MLRKGHFFLLPIAHSTKKIKPLPTQRNADLLLVLNTRTFQNRRVFDYQNISGGGGGTCLSLIIFLIAFRSFSLKSPLFIISTKSSVLKTE